MEINYALIGKRIRETRKQRGLSAEELAEIADLSTVYISYIENAKRKPSLESLIKISNALEITIDELLYGNLLYNPTEYQTDIDLLMADCTSTEKRYIFEVLSAIKNILRINDWHLSSKHNYDADNLNDYYDVSIKEWRLKELQSNTSFTFFKGSIADKEIINNIFEEYKPSVVVNLAAQAGVRYSITNPDAYIEANLIGFYNILEACRHNEVEHLVYASSSSVYGSNKKVPYSTEDKVDNPVSLYAATKKSNELMAHAYSKLYNIPSTGLRFFTVYGPAGRPDMAYFGFTNKLRNNETIKIFNYGNCKRDFTYIDDIVEGIIRVMKNVPEKKIGEDGLPVPPYSVYNIGNNHPENLLDFVYILQQELISAGVLPSDYDFESHKELVAMQPGDVPVTYADTTPLEQDFGFKPNTSLRYGLRSFAKWYKEFYIGDE